MLDPVTLVLVPGLLGGIAIALLLFRMQGRSSGEISPDAFRDRAHSTDFINMAHIRVAGVGGLGFVAMAGWVALNVPRIGQTVAIGLVTGAVLAAVLIYRRRDRAIPSSGGSPGANTMLALDEPVRHAGERQRRGAEPQLRAIELTTLVSR